MTNDEMRRQYKAYWREHWKVQAQRDAIMQAHLESEAKRWAELFPYRWKPMPQPELPAYPEQPEWLNELTCGAKTRAGTPCKMRVLYGNGRCKLHGGLSSGPTTAEGKARSAANGKTPKRKQTP